MACGVGMHTVQRIIQEVTTLLNETGTVLLRSTGKNPRRKKPVTEIDDFDKMY